MTHLRTTGKFSNIISANNSNLCTPCVPGYYASNESSKACALCVVGTSVKPGAVSCEPCKANTLVSKFDTLSSHILSRACVMINCEHFQSPHRLANISSMIRQHLSSLARRTVVGGRVCSCFDCRMRSHLVASTTLIFPLPPLLRPLFAHHSKLSTPPPPLYVWCRDWIMCHVGASRERFRRRGMRNVRPVGRACTLAKIQN